MNKGVIITGGSKRIGFALAQKSIEMGYNVCIHYHNSPQPAYDTYKNTLLNKRVFFFQSDLSEKPEEIIDFAQTLPFEIVGLVNNASVFTKGNLHDPQHLESLITLNVLAPIKLSHRFNESIKKGWIINITDGNIRCPNRNYQNYRITKKILEEITKQQAFLCAPEIRVNAIAPGAILPPPDKDEHYFDSLSHQIPLQKTGSTDVIADAYAFLVNSPYITGEILFVDGGWHLS